MAIRNQQQVKCVVCGESVWLSEYAKLFVCSEKHRSFVYRNRMLYKNLFLELGDTMLLESTECK